MPDDSSWADVFPKHACYQGQAHMRSAACKLAIALRPVQRSRHAASGDLCWQLHPEQLQLAPGAMGLVTALTSIPIEAERHPLIMPGKAQVDEMANLESGHPL